MIAYHWRKKMTKLRIKREKTKKKPKVVSKVKAYIDGLTEASNINKKEKEGPTRSFSKNSLMGSNKGSSRNLPIK